MKWRCTIGGMLTLGAFLFALGALVLIGTVAEDMSQDIRL